MTLNEITQLVYQKSFSTMIEHGPHQLQKMYGQVITELLNPKNHLGQFLNGAGNRGEKRMKVQSDELCEAIEALLAIDYSKRYMPWSEQNIVNQARALAKRYRTETNSISPVLLKPSEEKTFQDGQLELAFDYSEPTEPDVSVPEYSSGVPSSVTPELVNTTDVSSLCDLL